ncbi:transcriptional regulator ATRX-like isoform X2 [Cimex lectularius]|uniref:ATP-dependent helicase ATRX n=1 Tax=Cimex lectularius TaxID=79782 RepID=A0A8I6S5J0_CIMLE|nr:transcriptional regulator ATRX-like isoform X2 [Cimex lectularius]
MSSVAGDSPVASPAPSDVSQDLGEAVATMGPDKGNEKAKDKRIPVTEAEMKLRKKLYPDVSVIKNQKILCTACFNDIKHVILLKENLYEHIFLKVVLCKHCYEFYGDGEFSNDEDGFDKYCSWCGQGGHLFMCSKCPHVFCKKCLKVNFGRSYANKVEDNDWQCLFCKPEVLYELRALCWAVKEHLKNIKSKSNAKIETSQSKSRKSILDVSVFDTNSDYTEHILKATDKYNNYLTNLRKFCDILEVDLGKKHSQLSEIKSLSDLNGFADSCNDVLISSIQTLNTFKKSMHSYMKKWQKQVTTNAKTENVIASEQVIELIDSDEEQDSENESKKNGVKTKDGRLFNIEMIKSGIKRQKDCSQKKTDVVDLSSDDEPPSNHLKTNQNQSKDCVVKSEINTTEMSAFEESILNDPLTSTTNENKDTEPFQNNEMEVSCDLFDGLTDDLQLDSTLEPPRSEFEELQLSEEVQCSSSKTGERKASSSKIGSDSESEREEKAAFNDKNKAGKLAKKKMVSDSSKDDSDHDLKNAFSDSSSDINKKELFPKKSTKKEKSKKRIARLSSLECGSSATDPLGTHSSSEEDFKAKNKKKPVLKKQKRNKEKTTQEDKEKYFSSSDEDFKKFLDISSLNYKQKEYTNEYNSGSSCGTSPEQKKGTKSGTKNTNKGLSLLDCLDESGEEEGKTKDNEGGKDDDDVSNVFDLNIDLEPSFKIKRSEDGRILSTLLSEDSDSVDTVASEIQLDISDDEKRNPKKKALETKSKGNENKEKRTTNSKKRYTDKLLSQKLSDDSCSDEDKVIQKKERTEKKIVKDSTSEKRKKIGKRNRLFSNSEDSSSFHEPSSSSSDDDDFGSEDKEKKPAETTNKKRKRIQVQTSSDSDASGSTRRKKSNVEDSGGKGRKNIRRVLKEDDLKESTQAALKEEQERKKRIAEKQKLYNKLMEIANTEVEELKEVVLDFDPDTKTPLLSVDPDLVKKLKPHQASGVKFMWDSCFESLKDLSNKKGSGCILAHCMGLGKTLQVITLAHTILSNKECKVNTILVVAPVSTVLNWVSEFNKWLKDVGSGQDIEVFHFSKVDAAYRTHQLKEWHRCGGVMIMGYNLFRSLSNPPGKVKKSYKQTYTETLLDPGPDVVICDEGHILKNESTAISKAMNKLKTLRRIVLTGTPLQNNLVEYHCMVQFVKPNLLGTRKEFKNRFVNPIQNGQFEDSTNHDVKIMKRRAHVLHTMLDGIVQRKDYNVLTPYLPPKFEYVIHLKLTDLQCKLYRFYLDNVIQTSDILKRRLFADFQNLMRICLHPRALLMKAEKDEIARVMNCDDEEGSLKDFIDDGDGDSESKSSLSETTESSDSDSNTSHQSKSTRRTRQNKNMVEEEEEVVETKKEWWSDLVVEDDWEDITRSSKLFLFFTILKYCEEIGDKILVFSQSLYTLDIIEYFLEKLDENKDGGNNQFAGSWIKGADYFRLDGSTGTDYRHSWCKNFNKESNTRARLFLISTRAGGLGINLTGANRVILFDASWNPSYDVQSIFRVYRFGQTKPCYIYRFLSKGTMEEKIYERQVAKLSTSLRVIDEHQIDRHFSHSALAELYSFDPEGSELQGVPILPKDRLMAELLQNHKDIILSYHQHDSLLENKEDQELTEEERKAAWDEYENEKNPPAFTQQMTMDQSQQKIYGQLLVLHNIQDKLKKQNPSLTKEQLYEKCYTVLMSFPEFQMTKEKYAQLDAQLIQLQAMNLPQFSVSNNIPQNLPQQSFQYRAPQPMMNYYNVKTFPTPQNIVVNRPGGLRGPNVQSTILANSSNSQNRMNLQNSAANNQWYRQTMVNTLPRNKRPQTNSVVLVDDSVVHDID